MSRFCNAERKRLTKLKSMFVLLSQALINYHQQCVRIFQNSMQIAEAIDPNNNLLAFCSDEKSQVKIPLWQARGESKASYVEDEKEDMDLEHVKNSLLPPVRNKSAAEVSSL